MSELLTQFFKNLRVKVKRTCALGGVFHRNA